MKENKTEIGYFEYRNWPFESLEAVVAAYLNTGSFLMAVAELDFRCSRSTVRRVVKRAIEVGVVDESVLSEPWRPRLERGPVLELIELKKTREDLTNQRIAERLGIGVATVYRIIKSG